MGLTNVTEQAGANADGAVRGRGCRWVLVLRVTPNPPETFYPTLDPDAQGVGGEQNLGVG